MKKNNHKRSGNGNNGGDNNIETWKIISRQTTNSSPKKEFESWFAERNPSFTEVPQRRDEDDE